MNIADLRITEADRVVTAVLTGEVDLSNSAELESVITQGTGNEMLGVVLDLTGVEYLDSAGIHLLYRLRELLRSRGQQLRLVIPVHSPARDALRLAGVEAHMQIVETVQQGAGTIRTPDAPVL